MLKGLLLTFTALSNTSSSQRNKPKARRLLSDAGMPHIDFSDDDRVSPRPLKEDRNAAGELCAKYLRTATQVQQTEEQLEAPDQMDEQHEKLSPLQKDIIRYHLTTGKFFAKHQQIYYKWSIIQTICKKLTNGFEF